MSTLDELVAEKEAEMAEALATLKGSLEAQREAETASLESTIAKNQVQAEQQLAAYRIQNAERQRAAYKAQKTLGHEMLSSMKAGKAREAAQKEALDDLRQSEVAALEIALVEQGTAAEQSFAAQRLELDAQRQRDIEGQHA